MAGHLNVAACCWMLTQNLKDVETGLRRRAEDKNIHEILSSEIEAEIVNAQDTRFLQRPE
jgi:hypothetical protein